jgi:hypothetical protein
MNYLLVSDGLWYLGHILTGTVIIFGRYNYTLNILLALFGQIIIIISRPIGRITNTDSFYVTPDNIITV